MPDKGADVVAYVEARGVNIPELAEIAERVDRFHGIDPPDSGYSLGEAFCAVMNGGTVEDIHAVLLLVQGWNFAPKGGWQYKRKGKELIL